MNTPNPLVPQGTFADKGKAHIRNTVFVILAGHLVLLVGLLFAGCNKKDAEVAGNDATLPTTPTPVTGDQWPGTPSTPTPGLPVANALPPAAQAQPPATTPTTPATTLTPVTPTTPAIAEAPVPAGFTEHTVLKNETFSSISKKYNNVGYQAIAAANPGVDPGRLSIGQKIKIPPPRTMTANARTPGAPIGGAGDTSGEKTYVVKSGDRLYDLAKTYGVTVKQIQAANNLATTQIRVGQKLKIPSKAPSPIEATTSPPAAPTSPGLPTDALAPQPGTAPR